MPVPMDGMPIVLRPRCAKTPGRSVCAAGQQPVRTRDDGAQRRLRRVVGQAHRPFGVCAVAAADERRGCRRRLGSWWNAVISTAMPCA